MPKDRENGVVARFEPSDPPSHVFARQARPAPEWTGAVLFASAQAADGGNGFVMALGQIARPDRYEMSPDETVWSLKEKAGGTTRIWPHKVPIRRKEGSEIKVLEYHFKGGIEKSEEEYWRGIAVQADDLSSLRRFRTEGRDQSQDPAPAPDQRASQTTASTVTGGPLPLYNADAGSTSSYGEPAPLSQYPALVFPATKKSWYARISDEKSHYRG